jgi:hypothetical protein
MCTIDDTPIKFGIGISINLIGGVAVVFVRVWAIGYGRWAIGEVVEGAKVVAKIVVGSHTYLNIEGFGKVFGR